MYLMYTNIIMIYITDLIKQLVEFSPNMYLFYGHDGLQSWFEAVDPRKTKVEAQKVKIFVAEYPVAGLILKGIYYNYNIVSIKFITTNNCIYQLNIH